MNKQVLVRKTNNFDIYLKIFVTNHKINIFIAYLIFRYPKLHQIQRFSLPFSVYFDLCINKIILDRSTFQAPCPFTFIFDVGLVFLQIAMFPFSPLLYALSNGIFYVICFLMISSSRVANRFV